jgi:hypothetical protein
VDRRGIVGDDPEDVGRSWTMKVAGGRRGGLSGDLNSCKTKSSEKGGICKED